MGLRMFSRDGNNSFKENVIGENVAKRTTLLILLFH